MEENYMLNYCVACTVRISIANKQQEVHSAHAQCAMQCRKLVTPRKFILQDYSPEDKQHSRKK